MPEELDADRENKNENDNLHKWFWEIWRQKSGKFRLKIK